jgi:tRNA U34 5-methylaminomethyl-2-thiouridine-forming methyltransferase MnmC
MSRESWLDLALLYSEAFQKQTQSNTFISLRYSPFATATCERATTRVMAEKAIMMVMNVPVCACQNKREKRKNITMTILGIFQSFDVFVSHH